DGRDLRRVQTNASDPAVSPDRSELAYASNHFGREGIHVMNVDGSDRRRLTHGVLDDEPAWSSDGRRLVFLRTLSPGPSGAVSASSLYLINADGSGRRRLAGAAVDFPGPTWINDRQILLRYQWGELATLSARTGKPVQVIRLPNKGTQPGDGPKLSPDGREI